MRFGNSHHSQRRAKRPPNYFSRSSQWRLLAIVFSLMLVLVLMERVRNPKTFQWLWSLQSPDVASHQDDQVVQAKDNSSFEQFQPDAELAEPNESATDPRQIALADAWRYVIEQLTADQLDVLSQALHRHRQAKSPDEQIRGELAQAVQAMNNAWQKYLDAARTGLQEKADGPELDRWQQTLESLDAYWANCYVVLQQPDKPWVEPEPGALATMQLAVDEVALRKIQDNKVFQPTEQVAWFRLFEKLRGGVATADAGKASYLQLSKQPNVYRGKLLKMRGTVLEARWVTAPKNALDLERYAVLWIRVPQASGPIAVYCATLPRGFPEIADARYGEQPTKLDLPIELTGYFFKRLAYRAVGGVEAAPLLIASSPRLLAAPKSPTAKESSFHPMKLAIVAAAALIMATVLVYALTPKRQRRDPLPDRYDAPAV